MINLVQTLESCWYLSPPWGKEIPPLEVSLLEEVYVTTTKSFGYCCGVEWSAKGWSYEIVSSNDNLTVLGREIIGTGKLQLVTKDKPMFGLGELVEFRFHGDGPPVRIVQSIQLICDCWFYCIEWMSPGISENGDASGEEKMGQASYPTAPPSTQTSTPKKPAPFSKPFPRDELFTFRDAIASGYFVSP
ncbi:DUF1392 family protein [Nostoc sp. UCD121]|uniref:DUF1392 family protein n=1 Tax=Nostoc sp. UCD121 TaxID=2681305 RepID=UPI001627BFFC|nr:DUF1392 family protein [Nostoc sp. UCD121]MBC1279745.1 DUF1392 family protein [Nostoc sp. UCD121]